MSFERKITAQGLQPIKGHKPGATGEQAPGIVQVLGGKPQTADRGHEHHGQTIHSLFELRNKPQTCIYATDGAVSPGEFGAYVFRFDGAGSVTLNKSPSVPTDQHTPTGKFRTRDWEVSVMIFHATETTVSWPADVKWGRLGYKLSDLDPENPGAPRYMEELQGPPENPRAAGTADVFVLRYVERTGEWWATITHAGVAASDPMTPPGDATDPPAPEEPTDPDELNPGEDDTDEPENVYTDPETGEPLVPEAPDFAPGNLIALHDAAVSYSNNCGRTWLISDEQVPIGSTDISAMAGEGVMILANDTAFFSQGVSGFRSVTVERPRETVLPIENGGFETGDFSGWTLKSGLVPLVLDTVQPPQRGGMHYLASNPSGPQFELSQFVDFVSWSEATITLTADVYTSLTGAGEVEVRADWDGQTYDFPDVRIPPGSTFNANRYSDSLAQIVISGPDSTRLGDLVWLDATLDNTSYFEWRFADSEMSGTWRARIQRNGELSIFTSGFRMKEDTVFVLTNSSVPDGEIRLTVPAGWAPPMGYSNYPYGCESYQTGGKSLVIEKAGYVQTLSIPSTGQWQSVSMDIPASVGSPIEVILRGTQERVIFDNVRLSLADMETVGVTAIGQDLERRQHLLTTEKRFFRFTGGQAVPIGEAPFAPSIVAAAGDLVAVASGKKIAFSSTGGATFIERAELASEVSQIIPLASIWQSASSTYFRRLVIVLGDGSMFSAVSYDDAGDVSLTALPAPGGVEKAGAWKRWVHYTSAGAVNVSPSGSYTDGGPWEARKYMPASQATVDRALAMTDIGRAIGYGKGGKDLFWSDDLEQSWELGRALTQPILKLVEIR